MRGYIHRLAEPEYAELAGWDTWNAKCPDEDEDAAAQV